MGAGEGSSNTKRIILYVLVAFAAICCVLALGLGLGLGLRSPAKYIQQYANGTPIGSNPHATSTSASVSSTSSAVVSARAFIGRREMLAGAVGAGREQKLLKKLKLDVQDDRFSYLHQSSSLTDLLLDDDKPLGDLPADDIAVPYHLLPPYQDEDDETVLPSASHPSYPYGNPYSTKPGSSTASTSTLFTPSASAQSLATSLPVLGIRHLHAVTTFGDARDRTWSELALDDLLRDRESEEARDGMQHQAGDAPEPAGQNAGDFPVEEGEEQPMEDD
ncbi:hypothetical protein P7C70_g3818, partial [Phenoliferia sp. Uapishka_3]